jgi:hypothetical protein
MGDALAVKMGEVSLGNGRTPFGKEMLKHFLFDPNFKNLNQGIYRCLICSGMYFNISQQAPLVLSPESSAKGSGITRMLANWHLIRL